MVGHDGFSKKRIRLQHDEIGLQKSVHGGPLLLLFTDSFEKLERQCFLRFELVDLRLSLLLPLLHVQKLR